MVRGSIPATSEIFFLLHSISINLVAQTAPLFNGYGLSVRGEGTGHEVTSSLQSSAEGRNEWSCTFISPIHLHGIDAQNPTFYVLARLVCGVYLGLRETR